MRSPQTDGIHGVTVPFKTLALNWSVHTQMEEDRCSHWLEVCVTPPPQVEAAEE